MGGDLNARYMRIKTSLQREIAGTPPHTRIRSRSDLVRDFKVSRTTIDRAISELIGEGILYARDGSGTYVAERNGMWPGNGAMRSWGVLLPDIRHYTYPGILRGIEHVGFENGVNVIVGNIENQAARQTSYLRNFIKSQVTGVIIVPARPNPSEGLEDQLSTMLAEVTDNGIPFVFCNRNTPGIEAPQVISNDFHGGYLAACHLIERGYRRIAYIAHPRYAISLNRYMGYASALAATGGKPDDGLVVFSDSWDFETPGRDEMGRMLDGPNPPDAVVCFTDLIAKGAYHAILERGLVPGRDVGIVGYDDSMVCVTLDIPLTSVKVDSYELGRQAAQFLLDVGGQWASHRSASIILTPELVARQSTERA
jgi:DNA-binding LacI/PurR family transcriptional regulator